MKLNNMLGRVAPGDPNPVNEYGDRIQAPRRPVEDETEQPERRNVITGDITRRGIRLRGRPHDINRLMQACSEALKAAEASGSHDEVFLIAVDPPHEDER